MIDVVIHWTSGAHMMATFLEVVTVNCYTTVCFCGLLSVMVLVGHIAMLLFGWLILKLNIIQ